jgi:uncharacterized protein YjbI with pentapeptide repeats
MYPKQLTLVVVAVIFLIIVTVWLINDTTPKDHTKTKLNYIGKKVNVSKIGKHNRHKFNFTSADLTGAQLQGKDLRRMVLKNADLSYANLSGSNLIGMDLTGINLTGANLTGAYLSDTNLTDGNFLNSNLTGANLSNAIFTNVSSGGIISDDTTTISSPYSIMNGYIVGPNVNLTGANLQGLTFGTQLNVVGAQVNGLGDNLNATDLTGANLTNANFNNSTINSMILDRAITTGSTFEGSIPNNTSGFTNATVNQGSVFSKGVNLHGLTFTVMTLNNVDLSYSNLTNTIWAPGTIFNNCNFEGADATGATFGNIPDFGTGILSSSIPLSIPIIFSNCNMTDMVLQSNLLSCRINNCNLLNTQFPPSIIFNQTHIIVDLAGTGNYLGQTSINSKISSNSYTSTINNDQNTEVLASAPDGVLISKGNLISAYSTLNGIDLSNANLQGFIFMGVNFSGVNFTNADLSGSVFSGCIFTACNFRGANFQTSLFLSETILFNSDSYIYNCDFASANMNNIHIYGMQVSNCNFTSTTMTDMVVVYCEFDQTNFTGSIWTGACLYSNTYVDCTYVGLISGDIQDHVGEGTGANFQFIQFGDNTFTDLHPNVFDSNYSLINGYIVGPQVILSCDFSNVTLVGTNLSGTDLNRVLNFNGVISGGITGTPILPFPYIFVNGYIVGPGVDLTGAQIQGSNLRSTVLTRVDFTGADLEGCNLDDVNCTSSTFINTNLDGASLTNANLTGCRFATQDVTIAQKKITPVKPIARKIISHNLNFLQKLNIKVPRVNKPSTNSLKNLSTPSNTNCTTIGTDFTSAVLSGSTFNSVNVSNANFSNSKLFNVAGLNLIGIPAILPVNYFVIDQTLLGPGVNLSNYTVPGAGRGNNSYTFNTIDSGVSLAGANFNGSNFSDMNFSGISLDGATFVGATLNNVNFTDCPMRTCDFSDATCSGTIFTNTDLTNAKFLETDLSSATLTSANLTNIDLSTSNMYGVLSGSITYYPTALPTSWIQANGYLMGPYANLSNLDINSSSPDRYFNSIDLNHCNFRGANISNINLQNVNFSNAGFYQTTLTDCNCINANFTGVVFAGCNLTGTDFTNSIMIGAALNSPQIQNYGSTTITNCKFNGSDFTSAVFPAVRIIDNATLATFTGITGYSSINYSANTLTAS